MTDLTDLKGTKREIEQEAYRYYEELSGQTLRRRADGSFASQGHNDALDAFRHAYTSGRVTQIALGQQWIARRYGDDNEVGPAHPNDPREHRMDLWNNEVGRRLGDDTSGRDELARRCYQALQDRTLIAGLNDPRIGQLYPEDPRLRRPAGDPEREMMTSGDVDRVNRDVGRALDRAQQRFPDDHPDRPMYDRLRSQLPAQVGDDRVAEAVLAAKRGGIERADQIGWAGVRDERIFISGSTPGFNAQVDLRVPAPEPNATVRQLDEHNRAQAYEAANRSQAEQQPAQQYGGR